MRRKKVAAAATIIRRLLAPIGDQTMVDRLGRALILVGFAGALRRSELAGIRIEHLEPSDRGLHLPLPRTKGSQTEAVIVALPYGDTELCPVRALEHWRHAAGIGSGPLFCRIFRRPSGRKGRECHVPSAAVVGTAPITAQSATLVVQRRAMAAGFGRHDLGGHSLKRGALTTGMERGVHPSRLKRLGRHKSYDVLGEYLEFGDIFDGHPGRNIHDSACRLRARRRSFVEPFRRHFQAAWLSSRHGNAHPSRKECPALAQNKAPQFIISLSAHQNADSLTVFTVVRSTAGDGINAHQTGLITHDDPQRAVLLDVIVASRSVPAAARVDLQTNS